MHGRTTSFSFAFEKKVYVAIGGLLLGVVLLYTFLVMQSIAHVVEREEIAFNTQSLAEEVSQLEKRYLGESQQITESNAAGMGLIAARHKVFIERGTYTLGTINR